MKSIAIRSFSTLKVPSLIQGNGFLKLCFDAGWAKYHVKPSFPLLHIVERLRQGTLVHQSYTFENDVVLLSSQPNFRSRYQQLA